MVQDTLKVKILSPTQTIFEGEAVSVSSVNTDGKFDILPFHANFITLVQKKPIFLRVKKKAEDKQVVPAKVLEGFFKSNIQEIKYDFDMAIIYSKDNIVQIYTNIQPQF